ncbi:MAG: hypothetical protein ACPGVX_07405, partial [Thalassobaculaceae bacterium]
MARPGRALTARLACRAFGGVFRSFDAAAVAGAYKRAAVYAHYGPVLAGGRLVVASSDGVLRFFTPESGALV